MAEVRIHEIGNTPISDLRAGKLAGGVAETSELLSQTVAGLCRVPVCGFHDTDTL